MTIKFRLAYAAWLLLVVVTGPVICFGEAMENQTVLRIYSGPTSAGSASDEIGQITFGSDHVGRLKVTGSDQTKSSELSKAWAKIQNSEQKLFVEEHRQGVRVYGHKMIKPGAPEFRWAVRDTLEREFRYSVEVGPDSPTAQNPKNAAASLAAWYQGEIQKLTSQKLPPSELKSRIDALTLEMQKRTQRISAPAPPQAAPEAKPAEARAPVRFISVYVEPYYSGPKSAGLPPEKVKVASQFDDRLASTKPSDVIAVQDAIFKDSAMISPMTMFVLAARLYDVGEREASVFWFYAAKDRRAAARTIGKPEAVSGAVVACESFSELMGPTINGFAFCDIEKQLATLKRAAEWTAKNPYLALREPAIHRPGMNVDEELKKSAESRLREAKDAAQYFSDPKKREEMKAARKANGQDERFCFKD